MPYIPPHIVSQAKEMDLLTYLENYEPTELVKVSHGVYTTKTHDSLKISNGKWCWWSSGIGGRSALDYLIKVREVPFMEAVQIIMGAVAIAPPFISQEKPQPKTLILPQVSPCATKVVNYLHKRGIDSEIIQFCLQTGRVYESYPYHNAVFIGLDKLGVPKYASLRGIGSNFIGDATGSDKRYPFEIPATNSSDTVHLFESAIDLLSFATLLKSDGENWRDFNLLSLSGVYQPKKNIGESTLPASLERYLSENPHIRQIVLRLDNDCAGREASQAITMLLSDRYVVTDEPPSRGKAGAAPKDYNDMLCMRLGLPITRNRERDYER